MKNTVNASGELGQRCRTLINRLITHTKLNLIKWDVSEILDSWCYRALVGVEKTCGEQQEVYWYNIILTVDKYHNKYELSISHGMEDIVNINTYFSDKFKEHLSELLDAIQQYFNEHDEFERKIMHLDNIINIFKSSNQS